MESSNVFNTALIAAGSMLSGANLSQAEIFSLAVKLENDEFKGLTGGQGHGATLTGGVHQQIWTSGVKGTKENPYSFVAVPLMDGRTIEQLEEHLMLVQAGKEYYVDGEAVGSRAASLTNNMWTDLLRDKDEVGLSLHKEKLELVKRTTQAIKEGDPQMVEVIAKGLIRHAEIRDQLASRWLNLMLDAHKVNLNNLSREGIPGYAFEYAQKVFDQTHADYQEYELFREVYKNEGEDVLRKYRIYSLDPIASLQDAAKEKGIAIIEEMDNPKETAKEIMQEHKNVKSVLMKLSERKGVERKREYKFIRGNPDTEVIHKENYCRFKLDPTKVYFSSREGTERLRIAEMVGPGETVLVMFAGIGPFSILIAKKQLAVEKIPSIEAWWTSDSAASSSV